MRLVLLVVASMLSMAVAYNNGLGRTPVMGFNSWNYYASKVTQEDMMATADALVARGLAAKGYVYVGLDDGWAWNRTANGTITAEPATFPDGIAALAAYVHGRGLKFGIYSSLGTETCLGRPGTLGYETIDADTYARWGVDLVKMDNCHNQGIPPTVRYPKMSKALNATGRPMAFCLCEWGDDDPAEWAPPIAQQWRISQDIKDVFVSVLHNIDASNKVWQAAAPYGFNQADILEVGNGGLTPDETVAHFVLWCLAKSPLLIGTNVVNMTSDILALLSNDALISWNQDALGVQGHLVASYADPATPAAVRLVVGPCASSLRAHLSSASEAQSFFRGTIGTGAAGAASAWTWDAASRTLRTADGMCAGRPGRDGTTLEPVACGGSETAIFDAPDATARAWGEVRLGGQCVGLADIEFELQVWAGPLTDGRVAVVLFNRGLIPRRIAAKWHDIGLKDGQSMTVVNVVTGQSHGTASSEFAAEVPVHSVVAVELTPAQG